MKLSIVVVITDNFVFKTNALESFNNAKAVCNTTCIPFFNNYKKISLISSINQCLSSISSDVIAIIHQDALLSRECWRTALDSFKNPMVGVVGFAGISDSCSYSDCHEHGLPIDSSHIHGSVYSSDGNKIWDGQSSGTIYSPDDFAFLVRNVGSLSLSIRNYNHHYAADISIRYKMAGFKSVAVDSNAVHNIKYSSSSRAGDFLRSLIELRSRWIDDVDEHIMTHSFWSSNVVASRLPMSLKSTSSTFNSSYTLIKFDD